jgi:hypothetical protein
VADSVECREGPVLLCYRRARCGAQGAACYTKGGKAKAQRPKAREKTKRTSPPLVAEQIQGLSNLLPTIAQTLAEVQQEQFRLREVVEGMQ